MPLLIERFITEDDIVSDIIRFDTNSRYSHVDVAGIDEDIPIEELRKTPDIVTAWTGAHAGSGVQARPANYCTPTRERRYAIHIPDKHQYADMMAYRQETINTKYDYLDIAGLLAHLPLHDAHRTICSKFGFDVPAAGSLFLLNDQMGYDFLITPGMLHASPYFRGRCYYSFG
jgi:hypothetical protein